MMKKITLFCKNNKGLPALLLGILMGFLLKYFCSEDFLAKADYYVFELITGLFMNALKIVVGPVVFFSMALCISGLKDLRSLGRIAAKTMGLYLCTTLVAIAIGFGLYTAFPIGDPSISAYAGNFEEDEQREYSEILSNYENADFSARNLIGSLIPDNMFSAFENGNLLQIIFLALLVGLGIGKCGEYSGTLINVLNSFNHLFMVLTRIIIKFIPIAIFCAMTRLTMSMGFFALKTILSFALMVIAGMLLMVAFYGLFIFVTTGLNPFIFYRKFAKAMMTAFATSSAVATMPSSLSCLEDMGVSAKISGFTIPLGANINMDGSSMVFMLVVLFMTRVYGIELTLPMLFSVVLSIVLLALGSPTVAGADLVIIAILLKMVGVPMEAIGLILGVDTIFDMIQALSNTTGDAAVTLVVSCWEKETDKDRYNA